MHVNNLPPELLALILCQVYWYQPNNLSQWSKIVPTMAVCRKWKAIMLPCVYKIIIVEPLSKKNSSMFALETETKSNKQATSSMFRSNIDILPTGCHRMPRALIANIGTEVALIDSLQGIISILQNNSYAIAEIRDFRLNNVGSKFDPNTNPQGTLYRTAQIRNIANSLVALCPNVNILKYNWLGNHDVLLLFAQAVAKLYMPQLDSASFQPSHLTNIDRLSYGIRNLKIIYGFDFGRLPCINSKLLIRLSIINYTDGFRWECFESNNNTDQICFQCLRSLEIKASISCSFEDDVNANTIFVGPKEKMKHLVLAPSLKFVRVDLCQSSCSFLYSIASQTVLEELVITIPNGITLEFHNFKITDNVKSIFVKHSDSEMGIINGMEFANDILGLSDVAMSATANYSNHMRSSDIEKVKWNSVDVLKIHTSIKLSSLSMIIQQIPKLSRLEACYLTLDIDVTDTSIASALQHALSRLPAPFSSNIKSLLLGFVADNVPDKVYSQIDSALRSNIESLITLDFVKR